MWDLFISHASEDKASVARPLAEILREKGIRVWIDETELCLGDSLRAKIDEGLAQSRFGLVIVSRAFLSKRWPIQELNGLVARESGGQKVILPIWHGVDHRLIAEHSPILADKLAEDTANGLEKVADKIVAVVRASDPDSRLQRRVQRFINDLNSPDVEDRLISVSALGQLGGKGSLATLPLLYTMGQDQDAAVRTAARKALTLIGAAAVESLSGALRDQMSVVRVAAGEALAAIGPLAAPAIPALIEALHDDDKKVQETARSALAGVGAASIPHLIRLLEGPAPDMIHAVFALVQMRDAKQSVGSVTPVLIRALQHADPEVRIIAAVGFTLIPVAQDQAAPALVAALSDDQPAVRVCAVRALGKFGTSAKIAIPALTALLKEQDNELAAAASAALTLIEQSVP